MSRRYRRTYLVRENFVLITLPLPSSFMQSCLYRLPPSDVGMIIDRGQDFPPWMQNALDSYGRDMWLFRDHENWETTKAVNIYRGDFRGLAFNVRLKPHHLITLVRCNSFAHLTPRIRLTPKDLLNTHMETPTYLHFICSPKRANEILSEVDEFDGWNPRCVYEPIPVGLFRHLLLSPTLL